MRTRTLSLLVVTLVLATVAQTGVAAAIIGGNLTTGNTYPYYVRLTLFGDMKCGGSVIAERWVLTAAHCVEHELLAAEPFLIGAHISDNPVPTFSVEAVILHPLWVRGADDFGSGHDLALLRFPLGVLNGDAGTSDCQFAECPKFVPFPELRVDPVQVGSPFDRSVYAAGTEVVVVGRGFNTRTAETSTLALRDLHTVLRSDGDMDDFYYWQNTLMIGAGFTNKTICHGDSGGPLTVNRNGRIIQVGVASFTDTSGTHCDAPGAFMELDGPQLAWIASVVPSIMAGWGPCTTSTGEPGDPYALYGNYSGGHLDVGPNDAYGWSLGCQGSIPPPPPDDSPGPIDSVCMRKPWLCPDE